MFLSRVTRLTRRFRRDRKGASAVEFALIATPFLLLLMGTIELGLVFMVNNTLESATESAARRIRTGEFQNQSDKSASAFKTAICAKMSWLGSGCESALNVDARVFASFPDLAAAVNTNFDPNAACWNVGGTRDIMLVRASYDWKIVTPLLQASMANGPNGKRVLTSASIFRNEPYGGPSLAGAACS